MEFYDRFVYCSWRMFMISPEIAVFFVMGKYFCISVFGWCNFPMILRKIIQIFEGFSRTIKTTGNNVLGGSVTKL